jgi:RNA polymerase sigma factor (sigma-70 family)
MKSDATVFVVDPDAAARKQVQALAESMHLGFEGYALAQPFLEAYDASRPGCLVSEVRVADVNGLDVLRRLAFQEYPLPVIFLSAHASVGVIVRAIQDGAVDFLEKPPEEQELWEAIQTAIRVDARRRAALAEKQRLREQLALLNPKERQVLKLLSEDKSTKRIAAELRVSVRTVELRRARMMKKLKFRSPVELLHFAIVSSNGNGRHHFLDEPGPNDPPGRAHLRLGSDPSQAHFDR